MTGTTTRSAIRSTLLEAIEADGHPLADDNRFNAAALSLFRYQFDCNPIYRRYCEQRGLDPGGVRHWLEIPAVPTDAFKAAPLFCGDVDDSTGYFETSGTTQGAGSRGRHYHRETAIYDAALLRWFQPHLLPEGRPLRILSLVPEAEEAPRSSLSHMIATVRRRWGSAGCVQGVGGDGLRLEIVREAVADAIRRDEPLLVLGTSFAFVHLHDALQKFGETLRCPVGTRAMDTGGFKGKSREVARPELYRMIETALGIPEPWIVNEYGMTEMSSQFYDGVAGRTAPLADRRQVGPSWVRSVAVDPETLAPRANGEIGILRHVDLANLDSVMALQTSDVGRVTEAGVELRGRAAGAEARGCSIAVDDLLEAAGRKRVEG